MIGSPAESNLRVRVRSGCSNNWILGFSGDCRFMFVGLGAGVSVFLYALTDERKSEQNREGTMCKVC